MALLILAARISRGVGWPPQKAYTAAALTTTSRYKLVNENSAFILGIASPFLKASSTTPSWSSNGTADQPWQLTYVGSGSDVIPQSLISLFL